MSLEHSIKVQSDEWNNMVLNRNVASWYCLNAVWFLEGRIDIIGSEVEYFFDVESYTGWPGTALTYKCQVLANFDKNYLRNSRSFWTFQLNLLRIL